MPRARTKKSARRREVKEWRAQALSMHVDCVPMREIAKRLGKALSTVHEAIEKELAEITRPGAEAVFAKREEAAMRYAAVIAGSMKAARRGDAEAAHVVISANYRWAKLLGLEAPTRTEHTGKDGAPIMTFDLSKLTDEQLERALKGDLGGLDPSGDPESGAGGETPSGT